MALRTKVHPSNFKYLPLTATRSRTAKAKPLTPSSRKRRDAVPSILSTVERLSIVKAYIMTRDANNWKPARISNRRIQSYIAENAYHRPQAGQTSGSRAEISA